MSSRVYLPTVEPGRNPGGLWVRVCAGEELIAEHGLALTATLPDLAEHDAEIASAAAFAHGEARTYVYDGDTGTCIATLITRNGWASEARDTFRKLGAMLRGEN